MSNPYTDQTTASPVLNFYTDASQLTTQANPSVTELHMIPAGGVSLPSDRYIDFTAPATGDTYTAPADGWVVFGKMSSASNQYIQLEELDSNDVKVGDVKCFVPSTSIYICCTTPIIAGCKVRFYYNAGGNTAVCRFVYANGSPNVSAS